MGVIVAHWCGCHGTALLCFVQLVKLIQCILIEYDLALWDEFSQKRGQVRALNIPEQLGQVQFLFTDKTGTLTDNEMVLRYVALPGIDEAFAAGDPAVSMSPCPPVGCRVSAADQSLWPLESMTPSSPCGTQQHALPCGHPIPAVEIPEAPAIPPPCAPHAAVYWASGPLKVEGRSWAILEVSLTPHLTIPQRPPPGPAPRAS